MYLDFANIQKCHFKPELQKFQKHRSDPKRIMKLFVVLKDNHIHHLKKESSLVTFGESGNWILKKNKSLRVLSPKNETYMESENLVETMYV